MISKDLQTALSSMNTFVFTPIKKLTTTLERSEKETTKERAVNKLFQSRQTSMSQSSFKLMADSNRYMKKMSSDMSMLVKSFGKQNDMGGGLFGGEKGGSLAMADSMQRMLRHVNLFVQKSAIAGFSGLGGAGAGGKEFREIFAMMSRMSDVLGAYMKTSDKTFSDIADGFNNLSNRLQNLGRAQQAPAPQQPSSQQQQNQTDVTDAIKDLQNVVDKSGADVKQSVDDLSNKLDFSGIEKSIDELQKKLQLVIDNTNPVEVKKYNENVTKALAENKKTLDSIDFTLGIDVLDILKRIEANTKKEQQQPDVSVKPAEKTEAAAASPDISKQQNELQKIDLSEFANIDLTVDQLIEVIKNAEESNKSAIENLYEYLKSISYNSEKIKKLKDAIASGEYEVGANITAGKLIRSTKDIASTITPSHGKRTPLVSPASKRSKSSFKPIKAAEGGFIEGKGTDTSDNIPALLSPGEAVIPAKQARKHKELIQHLIHGKKDTEKFATGTDGVGDNSAYRKYTPKFGVKDTPYANILKKIYGSVSSSQEIIKKIEKNTESSSKVSEDILKAIKELGKESSEKTFNKNTVKKEDITRKDKQQQSKKDAPIPKKQTASNLPPLLEHDKNVATDVPYKDYPGEFIEKKPKPKFGKALKTAGALAVTVGAANLADAAAGSFGVGKNDIDASQDESNWNKMSFLEKAESGVARGIEGVGSFVGVDNITNEAKAARIKKETEYLKGKENVKTAADITSKVNEDKATVDTSIQKQMLGGGAMAAAAPSSNIINNVTNNYSVMNGGGMGGARQTPCVHHNESTLERIRWNDFLPTSHRMP